MRIEDLMIHMWKLQCSQLWKDMKEIFMTKRKRGKLMRSNLKSS
jgi:hypothetical protein